jgi:hypothetical protein
MKHEHQVHREELAAKRRSRVLRDAMTSEQNFLKQAVFESSFIFRLGLRSMKSCVRFGTSQSLRKLSSLVDQSIVAVNCCSREVWLCGDDRDILLSAKPTSPRFLPRIPDIYCEDHLGKYGRPTARTAGHHLLLS